MRSISNKSSPDGLVSIFGFASLLSENSAGTTFPDLVNFRAAKQHGFRRLFANATPIFYERGIAKPETRVTLKLAPLTEISSSCVEPCQGETLIVTVFEIKKSEVPNFMKLEPEFCFLAVLLETLNVKLFTNHAMQSVLAAKNLSDEADNFLDHTFLGVHKQLSVNTWLLQEQASWRRSLQNPSRFAVVDDCNTMSYE